MKAVHLPTAKRYAAISAYRLQQEIQLQNAQMGEGGTLIEMLPQQLMALRFPSRPRHPERPRGGAGVEPPPLAPTPLPPPLCCVCLLHVSAPEEATHG